MFWGAATTTSFAIFFFFRLVLNQMFVVLVFDITNMKKTVSSHTKVDEGRLNAGLDIDDLSLVDIADVVFRTAAFDVQLLQNPIFYDGNSAFLRLEDIDQHLFFHCHNFRSYERSVCIMAGSFFRIAAAS